MRYDIKNAIDNGRVVFKNVFDTERGRYLIMVVKDPNDEPHLFKYKNRKLVYAEKISKMKEIDI